MGQEKYWESHKLIKRWEKRNRGKSTPNGREKLRKGKWLPTKPVCKKAMKRL